MQRAAQWDGPSPGLLDGGSQSGLMQTEVVPRLRKPSLVAAALLRSMMRLPWKGPAIVDGDCTASPVRWSVT